MIMVSRNFSRVKSKTNYYIEQQKVPVDLCHPIDLENFWKKSISWNCLKREIYTQKNKVDLCNETALKEPEPRSRSQSWKFGSMGAIETELELEPKSWKFSSQPAPKWALELKAEWLSFAWTGLESVVYLLGNIFVGCSIFLTAKFDSTTVWFICPAAWIQIGRNICGIY